MASVKKMGLYGAIPSLVLLLLLAYLAAYEALRQIMPYIVYTGGGLIIIIGLVGSVGGVYIIIEMIRTRKTQLWATRETVKADVSKAYALAQKEEVYVITAPKGHQLVIRDNGNANLYQLHLDPNSRVKNGHYERPDDLQLQIFRDYQGNTIQNQGQGEFLELPAPEPEALPLLPALSGCDNILVVGGKGSGKTTLLQWLELERINNGQMAVVLDSHATPTQWLGKMVGIERDYQAILTELGRSLTELDNRHKNRSKGQENFTPHSSIIDEFTLLPRTLKTQHSFDIQDYSIPMLTEGRKVKLNCVWGIHSDRVSAMGLEGAGDIKECFDVVVYLKKVKDQRYAICDFGEGKEDIRYIHPGPFAVQKVEKPAIGRPMPTEEERKVLIAWWKMRNDVDFSGNKLHRKVSGLTSRANSIQLQKYRDLIEKFGENPRF